jgi:hypothetical protein
VDSGRADPSLADGVLSDIGRADAGRVLSEIVRKLFRTLSAGSLDTLNGALCIESWG